MGGQRAVLSDQCCEILECGAWEHVVLEQKFWSLQAWLKVYFTTLPQLCSDECFQRSLKLRKTENSFIHIFRS